MASKIYNILFLDDDNSCLSQLAEAVARKHFPDAGQYDSAAGHGPAQDLSAGLAEFMDSHGMDASAAKPKAFDITPAELNAYHVVVSLKAPGATKVGAMRVTSDAPDWAQFDWTGSGSSDPQGIATFGIYNRETELIYQREIR